MSNIDDLLKKYLYIPDERFFNDIFTREEYNDVKGRKSDIVIDIGATAGEFSAYVYKQSKTIYAIEPYKKYFDELTENIQAFHLDKIKPFNIALLDRNGTGSMSEDCRGGNKLEEGNDVRVMTLASFMKEQSIDNVDILKIDIEGMDNKVFESEDFQTVGDKISYIIGEHIAGIEELLKPYGFKQRISEQNYIYYK